MKTFQQFTEDTAAQLPSNMMDAFQKSLTPILKQYGLLVLPIQNKVEAINAIMAMMGVTPQQYRTFNAVATSQPLGTNPMAGLTSNQITSTGNNSLTTT